MVFHIDFLHWLFSYSFTWISTLIVFKFIHMDFYIDFFNFLSFACLFTWISPLIFLISCLVLVFDMDFFHWFFNFLSSACFWHGFLPLIFCLVSSYEFLCFSVCLFFQMKFIHWILHEFLHYIFLSDLFLHRCFTCLFWFFFAWISRFSFLFLISWHEMIYFTRVSQTFDDDFLRRIQFFTESYFLLLFYRFSILAELNLARFVSIFLYLVFT